MTHPSAKSDISGILIVDKPSGLTSNAVLQHAIQIFRATKGGHGGSLDPLASGVLLIFFGAGTRLSTYALDAPKRYRVEATLGARTTTGDALGDVVENSAIPVLNKNNLINLLQTHFTGVVQQVPPMYSAVKVGGRPLYKLARQGVEIERPIRKITVYDIQLLNIETGFFELDIRCSKGTYIRTLIEDIGRVLGCCAHVSALRRTEAGYFSLADSHTPDGLQALAERSPMALVECLLPLERGVEALPRLVVDEADAEHLRHGRILTSPGDAGTFAVFSREGRLLVIGDRDNAARLYPRRNFSAAGSGS